MSHFLANERINLERRGKKKNFKTVKDFFTNYFALEERCVKLKRE